MYDKNGDGIITKEEVLRLFVDDVFGQSLFNDLNVIKGNISCSKRKSVYIGLILRIKLRFVFQHVDKIKKKKFQ